MKKCVIFVIILLSSIGFFFAGTRIVSEKSIEEKEAACLSSEECMTTSEIFDYLSDSFKAWDKELNKNYKLLLSKLDTKGKKKLKDSQRKWIFYRDAESDFALYFHYDFMGEGTIRQLNCIAAKKDITQKRALELEAYCDYQKGF
jgi:uncharacterized protein YecT (DUF1311 family)